MSNIKWSVNLLIILTITSSPIKSGKAAKILGTPKETIVYAYTHLPSQRKYVEYWNLSIVSHHNNDRKAK